MPRIPAAARHTCNKFLCRTSSILKGWKEEHQVSVDLYWKESYDNNTDPHAVDDATQRQCASLDLRLGGTLDYLTSIVLGGDRFDLTFVKTGGLENSIKCEFWVIASRWMCGTSKHAGCKYTKMRWALLSVPKADRNSSFDRTHRHRNIIPSRHTDIKNKLKEKERRKKQTATKNIQTHKASATVVYATNDVELFLRYTDSTLQRGSFTEVIT